MCWFPTAFHQMADGVCLSLVEMPTKYVRMFEERAENNRRKKPRITADHEHVRCSIWLFFSISKEFFAQVSPNDRSVLSARRLDDRREDVFNWTNSPEQWEFRHRRSVHAFYARSVSPVHGLWHSGVSGECFPEISNWSNTSWEQLWFNHYNFIKDSDERSLRLLKSIKIELQWRMAIVMEQAIVAAGHLHIDGESANHSRIFLSIVC